VDESEGPVSEDSDDQAGTSLEPIDSVQEADEESFPASDAPSSWAVAGDPTSLRGSATAS